MSGLPNRADDPINGVDVREQGSALRVATNTPHLVSLGTGRLSTAVTLHPIKQGRVTIGSDPTCDIYVIGTGVANVHCRVENSHGVVTLYPTSGTTLLDGLPVEKPTRLSQGSMLTIGRSNYLRFNHPEEAKLMKSVLPSGHVSMAPIQFTPNEQCIPTGFVNHLLDSSNQCYQNTNIHKIYKDNSLTQLDQELDMTLKEMSKRKPPVAPRKPYKDLDTSDSNSDHETKPKAGSIMAKVSKFEYYAKQSKNVGRSQFYTTGVEISPKVFSSNSLTVNTPAKDVLGTRNIPVYMNKVPDQKIIVLNENNSDPKNLYANVAVRNKKIDDIVRNFDETSRSDKIQKNVNTDQRTDNIYGKINADRSKDTIETKNDVDYKNFNMDSDYGRLCGVGKVVCLSSPAFDRNPQYSPVYANSHFERNMEAENMRVKLEISDKMTTKRRYQSSKLIEKFVKNLKKNTSALKKLKKSYDTKCETNEKILNLTNSVDEKLQVVHKMSNDIKIYKTINTILTNHYIKETRDHENTIDAKIIDLERHIQQSYQNLRDDLRSVASDFNKNIIVLGNDVRFNENEFYIKNQNYSELYSGTAYQDRVKEEKQKEAETARLEEILNMCAEYERQITSGVPITPTEKRSHNKIITNGSLPRSITVNNPNFVQTTDGYYRFDTNHTRNTSQTSLQRNVSSYENFESPRAEPVTPVVTTENNYENIGRMDEIGIPVFEDSNNLSSPIMIRKLNHNTSPICSPYENVYLKNNLLKPNSPNTQSPRTRIKTSFAHKNLPSPQYFIFPPKDFKTDESLNSNNDVSASNNCDGIEKQLSLEEEIPMIDDLDITNDIELRHSKVIERNDEIKMTKNKSFDDVKKELMADIPELEEFENDLQKREKMIHLTEDFKNIDIEASSVDSVLNDSVDELKSRYENLKEERRKLVAQIHEVKCKMTEIRSQEDDILRELEMEKALIKGEYDSEIAILNIEQKKKSELIDNAKKIEEEIRLLKEKQESRQNEARDRVDIATMKVEKIERDLQVNKATLEELQNAQDILENENRTHEDLEFTHLEEESEMLANREDIQNEITLLSKKIDAQKTRILTLKSEANENLTSAVEETKVLQAEYVKLLNQVEHLTGKVQIIEKELKPIVNRLNEERNQSPDSAFYTDQTRAKSGEFGYSPPSSDDDVDMNVDHTKQFNEKFSSIDQMSQSMIVDIERRVANMDDTNDSPSKSSKEKKGFWERNFDSLKRKKKKPEKLDIMSQSLNENMFYNDNIEVDTSLDKFNSLRNSKKNNKNGPLKSNSSSKIPTFAALGKIIKKDSLKRKETQNKENKPEETNNRYIKNGKVTDNKYKSKSLSPDKNAAKEETNCFKVESLKILHRKSCGDEPSKIDFQKITDSGKIPSQDDIDRISKVTIDAPILSSDTDVNSLGKRTLDSLMEIERKRIEMLEEKGCQMIENEREKISELKKRVQDETKKLWDQRTKDSRQSPVSMTPVNLTAVNEAVGMTPVNLTPVNEAMGLTSDFHSAESAFGNEDVSFDYNITNSTIYEESSGFLSSSIEELQVRNSRTESTEDDKRSDDSRPLSHASDFSRDNILSLSNAPRRSRRGVSVSGEWRRPLTRYLPVDRDDFDLRTHVESAGHQVELCPYVTVNSTSCRGYLHKLGAKFHTWSKRWFVFDRESKTFVYYWDKSERKPRGGAYFQVIEEVYLDHGNTSKSPNPQTTFIVKTKQRRYYLMAPSGEAARVWIDVIFTGAQGYTEYLE